MNLLEQLICWWKVQNLKKAWTGTGERAKEIQNTQFEFDDSSMVVHHYLNENPAYGGEVGYRGLPLENPIIQDEFQKSYEHYQYSFKVLFQLASQATITPQLYLNGECQDVWVDFISALKSNDADTVLKFYAGVNQTLSHQIGNQSYIFPKNQSGGVQNGYATIDLLHSRMDVINQQILINNLKNAAVLTISDLENFKLSPECLADIDKVNFKQTKNYKIVMRVQNDECKLLIRRDGYCYDFEWQVKQIKDDTLYYRKPGFPGSGYFKLRKF